MSAARAVALALLLWLPMLSAHSEPASRDMERHRAATYICAGLMGRMEDREMACAARQEVAARLQQRGYCPWPAFLPNVAREWSPCGASDIGLSVRVFFNDRQGKTREGDRVPYGNLLFVMLEDWRCILPIAGANAMRLYLVNLGARQRIGCWYPTTDGGYSVVYGNGDLDHQGSIEMLPRARIGDEGMAQIVEPGYDSETYVRDVLQRATMEKVRRVQQGLY